MRSYRPLIIIPLSVVLIILMVITSFTTSKKEIVGAWVSQENPTDKIEFLQNGIAKSYSETAESKPLHYTISAECVHHESNESLCVKIIDDEANLFKCYELKDAEAKEDNVLLLVDTNNNEEHFYTKVY
ncbi:hypothetical protein C8N46_106297 [Kordia periserrulae]|uniref:Uncharacterized protein n=1 Tax=Kordia periserrulae TaxID=701523 RepID=A0A2T6BX46_9FLAO|nr:hypothetical protein [Kordia periserrulae]PTX60651.1 hypothetical protein C8N46_106297 [Kordia periserrulae]